MMNSLFVVLLSHLFPITGIPAIIILFLATFFGVIVGIKSSAHNLDKEGVHWLFINSPTKPRSVTTCCVALPFWLWAIVKVIKNGDPDLGAISFLLVIASCGFVIFCQSSTNIRERRSISSCDIATCIMLLISNVLVSLNYALPIFWDLPLTFKIYVVIGALYWLAIAIWNWKGRSKGNNAEENHEYQRIE